MNGWLAVVLCTAIICITVAAIAITEARAKNREKPSEHPVRVVTVGLFDTLEKHVRNLDQAMTYLLVRNPEILESLPDDCHLKRVLTQIAPK